MPEFCARPGNKAQESADSQAEVFGVFGFERPELNVDAPSAEPLPRSRGLCLYLPLAYVFLEDDLYCECLALAGLLRGALRDRSRVLSFRADMAILAFCVEASSLEKIL